MLNMLKKCIDCDIYSKHKNNTRCQLCFFKLGSDGAETSKNLKSYGIEIGIPKSRFFYFLYYPELNCKFPDLPNIDLFGNKRIDRIRWNWIIHHEDENHSNDMIWNICLLLNTEHHIIHSLTRNPMDNIEKSDFINTIRKKYRQRYIQGKNLDENKIKYYDMINWLNGLKKGQYKINKKLCKYLGYSQSYSLKYGINSAIENNEINDISLLTNGKENSGKRWIIEKK